MTEETRRSRADSIMRKANFMLLVDSLLAPYGGLTADLDSYRITTSYITKGEAITFKIYPITPSECSISLLRSIFANRFPNSKHLSISKVNGTYTVLLAPYPIE